MNIVRATLAIVCLPLIGLAAPATNPATKPAARPAVVKAFPPMGEPLAAADRAELESAVAKLGEEIGALDKLLAKEPSKRALLPDLRIYHNALRYPLRYGDPIDMKKARAALAAGLDRAAQLRAGRPEWIDKDGPRGYVSKIDGSVQPYFLLMPTKAKAGKGLVPLRLDLFCHGRDERLTELNFISAKGGTTTQAGPEKLLALLYGRYCNANKFAGEVDCFEVIDDLSQRYSIDQDRIVLTGFSMGGAAAWHLAAHHPGRWAATSPGAGFADTAIYTGLAKRPDELAAVPWWQKKLWHLYDCPDWAGNFANVPTVAYAGELDKQILSSETMEKAMGEEGLKLERIIGPKTEHKYEAESLKEINKRLDAYAANGRDQTNAILRFTTYTLRYNAVRWLTVEGLERHWERADVQAERRGRRVVVQTKNVSALALAVPFDFLKDDLIEIDGTKVAPYWVGNSEVKGVDTSRALRVVKRDGIWTAGEPDKAAVLKRPGLQGPIDDAFLDRFLFVRPTGKPLNAKTGAWTSSECDRAIDQWRKIFRGEARVMADGDKALELIDASQNVLDPSLIPLAKEVDCNLVLFGDPSSNKVLARMADKLPVKWDDGKIILGDKSYPADSHVPVMIFPNPLNPKRYVVLNSGFTFREADHATNSKQIAKLPDYAIIDVTEPPSPSSPGRIVRAGFFGEKWELQPNDGQ